MFGILYEIFRRFFILFSRIFIFVIFYVFSTVFCRTNILYFRFEDLFFVFYMFFESYKFIRAFYIQLSDLS